MSQNQSRPRAKSFLWISIPLIFLSNFYFIICVLTVTIFMYVRTWLWFCWFHFLLFLLRLGLCLHHVGLVIRAITFNKRKKPVQLHKYNFSFCLQFQFQSYQRYSYKLQVTTLQAINRKLQSASLKLSVKSMTDLFFFGLRTTYSKLAG